MFYFRVCLVFMSLVILRCFVGFGESGFQKNEYLGDWVFCGYFNL